MAKNKIPQLISKVVLISCGFFCSPCFATLFVEEDFNYPSGASLEFQNGGDGFSSRWIQNSANGEVTIADDSIAYPFIQNNGGALRIAPSANTPNISFQRSLERSFNQGETVWMSFLIQGENVGIGHAFLRLAPQVGIGKRWGSWFAIENERGEPTMSPGRAYLLVSRFTITADGTSVALWLDPDLTNEPTLDEAIVTHDIPNLLSINDVRLDVQGFGQGDYLIDELKIADSWDDVISRDLNSPVSCLLKTASTSMRTSFYVTCDFSAPVTGLTADDFIIENGTINSVFGTGRIQNLLITPTRTGVVSLQLPSNTVSTPFSAQNYASNTLEVDYNPNGDGRTRVDFRVDFSYSPFITGSSTASSWAGDVIALILNDEEAPQDFDQAALGEILYLFDDTVQLFEDIIGSRPPLTAPYRGRIRLEIGNIGGGLANHGIFNFAIDRSIFQEMYESVSAGMGQYRPAYFYELHRNYWHDGFNPRIDYHTSEGPLAYGWWTVGFNNAMAIIAARNLGIELTGTTDVFQRDNEDLLDNYIDNPEIYDWENSWNASLIPQRPNTSLNDLMTGLLTRLYDSLGEVDFFSNLYRELVLLPILPGRDSYQQARDNFYLAVSRASGFDQKTLFENTLRWPLSNNAKNLIDSELPAVPLNLQVQFPNNTETPLLTIEGREGYRYRFIQSSDLQNWETIETLPTLNNDGTIDFFDTERNSDRNFYQLRVWRGLPR